MSLYPAEHFPGTPPLGRFVVERALLIAGLNMAKWSVPLEIVARYESDWNPYIENDADSVCPSCRGMMQAAIGMYSAAAEKELISSPRYTDAIQAVTVAIHYILGHLKPYYGGYETLDKFLTRSSVGRVIEAWRANPDATYSNLRSYYSGY